MTLRKYTEQIICAGLRDMVEEDSEDSLLNRKWVSSHGHKMQHS